MNNITTESKFIDNTTLSSYKSCPRMYQLRHILGWRRQSVALPLSFGLAWHSGQDALWTQEAGKHKDDYMHAAALGFINTWRGEGLPVDMSIVDIEQFGARTPMVAEEMYKHYIDTRWRMLQDSTLIACEQPFAVPLPEVQDTWYVGRLDKVIEYNGQVLIIEHKTTTEYKKDGGFKTSYIESWANDSQTKGYQYSGRLFFNVEQVWVDAALVHKQVHNAFRLIPVAHQMPILQEWVEGTREWIRRIDYDNEKQYWPKNEGQCIGKYGACTYLDICRTQHDPASLQEPPEGFTVEFWSPFETLNLQQLIEGDRNGN